MAEDGNGRRGSQGGEEKKRRGKFRVGVLASAESEQPSKQWYFTIYIQLDCL